MYFRREEQQTLAQNVRELLINTGGVWVTTDLMYGDLRERLLNSLSPEFKKIFESVLGGISNQVERDIAGNDFASEFEAIKFFEGLGFKIEQFPIYDGSYHLSTLAKISEEMKEPTLKVLSEAKGWILTPLG